MHWQTKRYVKFLLSAIILFCSGFCFYLSLRDLRPTYQDIAVFQSQDNPQEYILIQSYETLVTGNPHSRIIRTKEKDAAIRTFEELSKIPLLDTVDMHEKGFKNRIPKLLIDKSDTFLLREVIQNE